MQPNDSVHHDTIKLVSLNFRLRKRMAEVLGTSKCHSNSSRAHPAFQNRTPVKTTLATHHAWPAIKFELFSALVTEKVGDQNVKSQRQLVRVQIHLGVSRKDHAFV